MSGHAGVHRFTIGQRKGLGIAAGAPLYVLKLDAATSAGTFSTIAMRDGAGEVSTRCVAAFRENAERSTGDRSPECHCGDVTQ